MTDAELATKLEGAEGFRRLITTGELWEMSAPDCDRFLLLIADTLASYARRIHSQERTLADMARQSEKSLDAMSRFCEAHGIGSPRPN